MMNIRIRKEYRHIATLQESWEHDALRDARYNRVREMVERAKGNGALANAYGKEYRWDLQWAKRRDNIVQSSKRRGQ